MPQHRASPEHRDFAKGQRRASTHGEEIVWDIVRAGRLGLKFKRQVPFGPYVADFWCAEAKLIVEVDGRTHDDPLRVLKDADRDRWFAKNDIRILRLSNEDVVGSPGWAEDRIREAVALAAPSPCVAAQRCPSPSRGEGRS
ncbi:MAG TPA: endonuclease domain-containing protein [Microvirga sp.]|jgi:very-short-patch-repair endonuclease|nr:endonuclease domain-containing protein [Microvirga sp.]